MFNNTEVTEQTSHREVDSRFLVYLFQSEKPVMQVSKQFQVAAIQFLHLSTNRVGTRWLGRPLDDSWLIFLDQVNILFQVPLVQLK